MSFRAKLRARARQFFYRNAPESLIMRWMLMRYRRAAPEDFFVFDTYQDANGSAIDIGANRGVITRLLSTRFAHVHAFEPDPKMAAFLQRNAPSNVTVYQRALSDGEGTAILRAPILGGEIYRTHGSLSKEFEGNQVETCEVRITRLDALALDDIAFMKIDVEGHEISVLRGAEQTLKKQRPVLWIEIERIHGDLKHPLEVFEILHEYGYQGQFWFRGKCYGLEDFELDLHQPIREDGVPVAGRVVNFLFVPRK